ncbi:MAG TPA: TetR family transcriptional regulator C-terminal domain-containing protein, partial [Chthonomonadaceae bacterium]|nr:TetR family transcriptional regulator C-terminal domain-containing protein [Chthonomonadaceae bacterium]
GNGAMPPPERLEEFFTELCRHQSGKLRLSGCPLGNFAAALPDLEDERTSRFRQRLLLFFRKLTGAMEACLIEGMEQGDFRQDVPPEALAALLLGTMQGLLTLTRTHQSTRTLEQGTSLLQQLLKVP